MDEAIVRFVWQRADGRCEYCRMPQAFDESPFEIDHIIARKHGGATVQGNLALSCFHDNSHKGEYRWL
jgi:5-methylcytosine-specific restriction endonuclease McrA